MDLISIQFLFFSLAAIVGLRLPLPTRFRELVVLALSLVFFASYYTSLREALPVVGFLAFGYLSIFLVSRMQFWAFLPMVVALVTLTFAWLKQYPIVGIILPLANSPFKVVGLSYILFRVIHLLVDVAQRATTCPPCIGYLNYCLFFPAFVSGPIQKYSEFRLEIEKTPSRPTIQDVDPALSRIFLGILLVMIVSNFAVDAGSSMQKKFYGHLGLEVYRHTTGLYLAAATCAYAINIFANFAGYMHLVIGVMQLAGVRLPENFNQPYLAKNFLDFWARWHMTLSDWFKTYLFNPLMMQMTKITSSNSMAPLL
jgi:alginate O-acetyltransferase complex protein AlgI